MSSFVYDKCLLSECFGFLAGLAETKNRYGEPLLRLWNYKAGRVYNAEDFASLAGILFNLNAESVAEQYHDQEPEKDPEGYPEIFQAAKAAAGKMVINARCTGSSDFIYTLYRVHSFFRGILYQIEDPARSHAAGYILRLIDFELLEIIQDFSGIHDDIHPVNGWSGIRVVIDPERRAEA